MGVMFYSSNIMAKSHKGSQLKWLNRGADTKGMQAPDLVVGYDHPAWGVVAERTKKDDEVERLAGEVEVDFDQMYRLAEFGDPQAAQELGGAYLRIMGQRVVSYGAEIAEPDLGLENTGS